MRQINQTFTDFDKKHIVVYADKKSVAESMGRKRRWAYDHENEIIPVVKRNKMDRWVTIGYIHEDKVNDMARNFLVEK